MTQTLEAVFTDGGFRPVDRTSLPFSEGQRVKLNVEVLPEAKVDLVAIAVDVYQGLSDEEIDDIERLALDRRNFFDDRPAS